MAKNRPIGSHYRFYGVNLWSDLPLETFRVSESPSSPDLVFRCGVTAPSVAVTSSLGLFLQFGSSGEILLRLASVGCFLIRNAQEILCEPHPNAHPREIETFLASTVAGLFLHQREVLPLHASAVALNGKAICFISPPAGGKSTIAFALARRGAVFLADDISALNTAGSELLVSAGPSRVELWPEALEHFGVQSSECVPCRFGHEKRVLPQHVPLESAPVRCIVRLEPHRAFDEVTITRMRGLASVMPAQLLVYQHRIAQSIGKGPVVFKHLTYLASRVTVLTMRYPQNLARLDYALDKLLRCIEEAL